MSAAVTTCAAAAAPAPVARPCRHARCHARARHRDSRAGPGRGASLATRRSGLGAEVKSGGEARAACPYCHCMRFAGPRIRPTSLGNAGVTRMVTWIAQSCDPGMIDRLWYPPETVPHMIILLLSVHSAKSDFYVRHQN
jgi:hypothetical protein